MSAVFADKGEMQRKELERMAGKSEFRSLLELFQEIEDNQRQCCQLAEEINLLISKVSPVSPDDFDLWDWPFLSLFRFLAKRRKELRRAIGMASRLRIPEPPPQEFPIEVNSEIELEGRGRAKMERITLVVSDSIYTRKHLFKTPTLRFTYRLSGLRKERETLYGESLTRCLIKFREPIEELFRKALSSQRKYRLGLERLKKRILDCHAKEILIGDL